MWRSSLVVPGRPLAPFPLNSLWMTFWYFFRGKIRIALKMFKQFIHVQAYYKPILYIDIIHSFPCLFLSTLGLMYHEHEGCFWEAGLMSFLGSAGLFPPSSSSGLPPVTIDEKRIDMFRSRGAASSCPQHWNINRQLQERLIWDRRVTL